MKDLACKGDAQDPLQHAPIFIQLICNLAGRGVCGVQKWSEFMCLTCSNKKTSSMSSGSEYGLFPCWELTMPPKGGGIPSVQTIIDWNCAPQEIDNYDCAKCAQQALLALLCNPTWTAHPKWLFWKPMFFDKPTFGKVVFVKTQV